MPDSYLGAISLNEYVQPIYIQRNRGVRTDANYEQETVSVTTKHKADIGIAPGT